MSNQWKGYLALLVATVAMSNVYIFSKAALLELSLPQFGVFWFGFALIWNLLYLIFSRKVKLLNIKNRQTIKVLIQLGLIEIIATTGFFAAIKIMDHPANVSFLANIEPVYVIFLGFWILREQLKPIEIFGAVLTILGAFVISYKPNWDLSQNFLLGLLLIIAYTFIFALGKIISKKNIKLINPNILTINRTIFLWVFALIVFITSGESIKISNLSLFNTLLGSLLGPFLSSLSFYFALQYITATKASLFGSFRSFLILITSYLYFGILPLWYQIFGGVLTVIGVVIITLSKQTSKSSLTQKPINHL